MLFRVLPFDGSTTHFRVNAVFVSRSRRSLLFCFLILFFTIYFFIRFSDDVNGLDKYRCFLNKKSKVKIFHVSGDSRQPFPTKNAMQKRLRALFQT